MSTLTAVLVLVGLLGRTFRGCASVLNLIHTEKHDERQKKRPADKQCGPIGQNNGHLCR